MTSLGKKIFTVGFAAETENLLANAKKKLLNKKLDLMIANSVGEDCGFDQDDNEVIILGKKTQVIKLPKMQKSSLARELIKAIYSLM